MAAPRVLGPSDGHFAILGGTSARFMIEGANTGKRLALVEHPMQPRALAAPMHRHHREDDGRRPGPNMEIISPAGFENYFRELGAELLNGAPDPQRLAALCASYELDMDLSSVPSLIQRFGVRFPGGPPQQVR